jgi:DNA-binding LacI/PurR family transcriptional regulator
LVPGKVWEDRRVGHRRQTTARSLLASTLAEEILSRESEDSFIIASEHELCRRFNISRVTVRLALSDLEARGLIFRRHGKGTFAYGRVNRIRRSIGVLLNCLPDTAQQWPIYEIIRGLQWGAASLRTNVLLTHARPQEWSTEMISDLGGVLLFPSGITRTELELLGRMKMPTLMAWETALPCRNINFGQVTAARVITERLLLGGHERIAIITGFEENLDELKKTGIREAWQAVGKDPQKLIEFSVCDDDESLREVFTRLVRYEPNFTAVVAADDSIAIRFVDYLHSRTAIRVPETMSVASFHRSPFFNSHGPALSTVEFDFFEAGRRAAESLSRAFLSGDEVADIVLTGKMIAGNTIGRRSFSLREELGK